MLNTLVESAARLCDADSAGINRPQGDNYVFVASYGFQREFDNYMRAHPIVPDHGTVTGRAVIERRAIHVQDIQNDPEYSVTFTEAARIGGFRTLLGVPLLREGIPIGVIVLTRKTARPFNNKQIELAETFADQAVIAIENTRLFEAEQQRTRELTESLEQQTATSEVLKVISSSPGELEPVFGAMPANATSICDAKFGTLWLNGSHGLSAGALHGAPPAWAEMIGQKPLFRPGPHSPASRVIESRQTVHVADLRAERAYTEGDPIVVATADLAGVRTLLAVPMLKENELIGIISIYREEVRPFTDKQIELVGNFAAQAVIAIENTRLLNELRQRTDDLAELLQQQTATSEVLEVISSSPGELELVFGAMLDRAVRICEARFGNLYLREADGFRAAVMHNAPTAYAESRAGIVHPSPHSTLWQAAQTRQPAQTADITKLPGYVEGDPYLVSAVSLGGFRSVLTVPMLHGDDLVGAITIFRQEASPFTDKQVGLLTSFARQAVIAIENARLLSELRQRTDDLGRSVDELRALGEVSQAVNSTLDLENCSSHHRHKGGAAFWH